MLDFDFFVVVLRFSQVKNLVNRITRLKDTNIFTVIGLIMKFQSTGDHMYDSSLIRYNGAEFPASGGIFPFPESSSSGLGDR